MGEEVVVVVVVAAAVAVADQHTRTQARGMPQQEAHHSA
jgi:hypothetical protein